MSARGSTLVSTGALFLVLVVTSSCGDSTTPPKPTTLTFVTDLPPTAETMVPLTSQPVLQTVDASGHAMGGSTTITVTVIGATGVVAANGTATTNSTGLASFSGLTLGAIHGAVGPVTLQFAAPGLQPITATVDLHCALLPLSIGQMVSRSLTDGDCTFHNGVYNNMFALTTTQAVTAFKITASGAFPGSVQVRGPSEPQFFWGYGARPGTNSLSYRMLLPAGRNLIAVSSQDQLGVYSLTTEATSEDLTCENPTAFVASPITTVQKLVTGDCVENSFLEDGVVFGLPPNATINATMSSSAFEPQMKVINGLTQALVTSSTAPASTSVTFTNTAQATPFFLVLTSSIAGVSGAYNLSLNITYPPSAAEPATLSAPSVDARILSARRGAWLFQPPTPN